jgi:transcriptional regulator with XRE-family HTH domain
MTPGSGGRTELARDCGMSPSAMGRTLEGKTLPRPSQFELIARAVHRDVREALVEGGIISAESWTDSQVVAVRSQPTTPEQVLDSWGINDPTLRAMLLANIKQAMELSNQERGATANG